jgi:hypothetical protein
MPVVKLRVVGQHELLSVAVASEVGAALQHQLVAGGRLDADDLGMGPRRRAPLTTLAEALQCLGPQLLVVVAEEGRA